MFQPGSTSAFDQQFLRINAIEIDFKGNRPRYPISVKLEVNGKTLHKSPQFGKDEMVLWKFENCLNIPVPASLMLAVQEVHTFKRKKRFAEFGVASTDIVGMDVFSASDKDAKALVKFKCESALLGVGLSELLFKEAEGKLGNKKIILESLGKYGKLIAAVMKLSNFASNVHPAAGTAVAVIKVLYEKIKEQKECHAAATDLIKDLASFLPFVDDVPSDLVLDNETGRVIGEMLKLFCETSKFVIAYSSEGFLGDLLSSHQDEVDSARSEFKRLKDVYDWCIKIRVWKSVIEGGKRTEDAELRQLYPVMQAYYDQEGGCLEGTRTAVLEEIGNWAESESTLFWLHGVAGSGKSSIANSVAHMFEQQQRLPACFFCKRDDSECRTPKNIMPTLAYFLSKWHLDYRTFVLTLIQGKDEPKLAQGLQRQFNLLMKQPLASLSTMSANVPPRPLVIVVDALDECGDSAEARLQLAKILVELAGIVPWLKVFVTSRTLPEFQEVFLQDDTKNEVLDISTLDSKQVQIDILRFTKHCAQEYKVDLTDKQTEAFAVKAFGLFIWTSTVFRFISTQLRKDKAIENILSSVLAGTQEAELDRMYTVVVESASAGSDNLQVVKAVLGVLFCTARNRPLPENALLQFLTGVEQDINSTHLKNTIDSLQAVLYRDTSQGYAVRVCHPSFLDFVGNQLRSQKFWTQTSALDSIMTKRCLQIMISELKFNICGLESSFIADDDIPDIEDRITKHIPQYLQYSCLYWMSHLQSSGLSIGTQAMQDMLQEFLYNPRALYWLECLSIMKELKSGIDVLENFSKKYEPSNQFVTICKDLYRFVSAYHAAIAKSTTHLYVSALSWVPSESLLAKIFYKSCHSQPSISLGKEDSWKAALWVAGTENTMICATYSIDGKYLVSGSEDGSLRVWDTQTGGPAGDPLIGHSAPVRSVAYCPNRSHVVSGSNDKTLRIWDIQTGKPLGNPLRGHKSVVHSVAYSPDGRHIVSASGDMTLRIWDAQTGNAVGNPFLGHFHAVLSVSCSPDGCYVASGSADNTLRIWDIQTGNPIKAPFTGHLGPIISLAYSPSGQHIVSGSEDTTVRIWDIKTGNAIGGPLTGHSAPVMSVAFSADGKHIVSGSHDGTLRIWDVQDGVTIGDPLVGHSKPVLFVSHSPVDEHIVSGSPDRTLRAWDMQAAISTARDPLIGHIFAICSIAYSPDKKHLVSGSQDKTLRVWDVETGEAVGNPFIGHTHWVTSVAYSPDGAHIVSGSEDMTIRIWNAETGNAIGGPFTGHSAPVRSVAYSPDGRHIVSGSHDNTLRVWDAQTGRTVMNPFEGHLSPVFSVAYSPNGKHIVSGSCDNSLRIWDAQTGEAIGAPLTGHSYWVTSVAYSPDGSHIVSGSFDNTLRIWDAETGNAVGHPLTGHLSAIYSVCFSQPDGKYIVSGSRDRTIRIWDAHFGALVGEPLVGHSGWVTSVTYLVDKDQTPYIVSGSEDNTLRIWYAGQGAQAAQLVPPEVTREETFMVDGWIKKKSGELLLWVPNEYRNGVFDTCKQCIPSNAIGHPVKVDWEKVLRYSGPSWVKIFGPEEDNNNH